MFLKPPLCSVLLKGIEDRFKTKCPVNKLILNTVTLHLFKILKFLLNFVLISFI